MCLLYPSLQHEPGEQQERVQRQRIEQWSESSWTGDVWTLKRGVYSSKCMRFYRGLGRTIEAKGRWLTWQESRVANETKRTSDWKNGRVMIRFLHEWGLAVGFDLCWVSTIPDGGSSPDFGLIPSFYCSHRRISIHIGYQRTKFKFWIITMSTNGIKN